MSKRQKRFEVLADRAVNNDGFIKEWLDVGLVAMESPNDPKPSIKVEGGKVVELDGKSRDEFDMIDIWIADHVIDASVAEEAMALDSLKVARMLADINVPRSEIVRLSVGMTPAKYVDVLKKMNVVELMMAMQKLRPRRTPSNQAHVTNVKDHAPLLAADAAEAGLRGFAEIETTVGVGRYAPMNALSLLVGGQVGRPGVLAQCAVEEALELTMGMRGLTHYAETVSVYGTEQVFVDGDDTPWSKAFLGSSYASRGIKMRFTSGTGSEVQMGYAEGKSMLYLEIRCVMVTKGAGVQGLQNGSISCVGVPGAVPSGVRAMLAENVASVLNDLEVASGNDQTFTHSATRNCARMLMQFLPGTDFIFSGYSAVPNYDNMFAGSTHDSDDYDDMLVLQRDLQVDMSLRPVAEEDVIAVRNKGARALQAVFEELGLPAITDEEVEAATYAHGSKDMPDRNVTEDLRAIDDMMKRGTTGLDVAKALAKHGFEDVAESVLSMLKGKVSGDYLHTSAIFDENFNVIAAVNDLNDYEGPGTGYRLSGERWDLLKDIPQAISPELEKDESIAPVAFKKIGDAKPGTDKNEVVIGLPPAFGTVMTKTIIDIPHHQVLKEIMAGIEEEGLKSRLIIVNKTADVAFISHEAAKLSGSGIGIGTLCRGTTVIHQKDLMPLQNLELFPQSPLVELETFRAIGRNAAKYAKGESPTPVTVRNDPMARPKYQGFAALLHNTETQYVKPGTPSTEVTL
ncbi:MAG: propanediol/glycerol family dehydratase large subunit [Desulfobacterales bacterium]